LFSRFIQIEYVFRVARFKIVRSSSCSDIAARYIPPVPLFSSDLQIQRRRPRSGLIQTMVPVRGKMLKREETGVSVCFLQMIGFNELTVFSPLTKTNQSQSISKKRILRRRFTCRRISMRSVLRIHLARER